MLQDVLNLFGNWFSLVFKFYNETFMISETVSAWDFFLVCFVAGGIITLLIRAFGAAGSISGSSAVKNHQAAQRRQNNKKGG